MTYTLNLLVCSLPVKHAWGRLLPIGVACKSNALQMYNTYYSLLIKGEFYSLDMGLNCTLKISAICITQLCLFNGSIALLGLPFIEG